MTKPIARPLSQLREDALAIWQAAVEAVRSDRLVQANVSVDGNKLRIVDQEFLLEDIERIDDRRRRQGRRWHGARSGRSAGTSHPFEKRVTGWINVPADCVRELACTTLHAARAAGQNEPTEEGVAGTNRILELVSSLSPRDLCICLISGGGSALLPAPVEGISLADNRRLRAS